MGLKRVYVFGLKSSVSEGKSARFTFSRGWAYLAKKVLKAVAPQLDYSQLEEVQEGTGAQIAYLEAAFDPNVTLERKAQICERLTFYCRLDTWAMVVVAYFLARRMLPAMP